VDGLRIYAIEDDGTRLNIYDSQMTQRIKGTYPVLRERMYVSKGLSIEENIRPKVTNALAKGLTREANEAFETSKIISGSDLPTWGDPFYAEGTFDGGTASENFTREIIINEPLAKQLQADLGDLLYISSELPVTLEGFDEWLNNATWFRVEGIRTQSFDDEGDNGITIHLAELQYITGKAENDMVDMIVIDLYNPKDAEKVKNWLESDFEKNNKITAFTQDDIRAEIELFTSIYRGFSEMVAGITILVAMLFISTVMMISVKERTGEISALRALGFSRSSVFKLVLIESVLICMIGFVIGLIFGALGAEMINYYAHSIQTGLPEGFKIAKITPPLLLRATGSITIIGVLVGLIPAYWASRLNIVDALKSE
jgi:ABC-type lipoprotein release transport system permease subunit